MNQADRKALKAWLVSSLEALAGLEDTLADAGKTVALDQTRVGRLSRMDAMQAQQMALAASRRRQAEMADIERALGRITAEDYGVCTDCGEDIGMARLKIAPANPRCIDCIAQED